MSGVKITPRIESPARRAALRVYSTTVSADQISERLPIPADVIIRIGAAIPGLRIAVPARVNSWEIHSEGDATTHLQHHVDSVLQRARHLVTQLGNLRAQGCTVSLSLMQWIDRGDPQEVGFALSNEHVSTLAAIGADVDVSQYRG